MAAQLPEPAERADVLLDSPSSVPARQLLPRDRMAEGLNALRVCHVRADGDRAHLVRCDRHSWHAVVWLVNDAMCPGCVAEGEIARDHRTAVALLGHYGLAKALGNEA